MIGQPKAPLPPRSPQDWLVAALFALLVSATIRFHSLAPMPTMPQMVGNLLALDAVALLGLMTLGRRIAISQDVAILLAALAVSATISVMGSGGAGVSLVRLELYVAIALLATVFYLLYRDAGHVPLENCLLAVALVYLPFLFSAVMWIGTLTSPYWQFGPRVAEFQNVRQFGEFSFFAAVSATALGVVSRRMAVPSFLLAGGALFGIILTGCRGALLSWGLLTMLLCGFCRGRLRIALLGFGPLVLAALLVWYLDRSGILPSPNVFGRLGQLVQDQGPEVESGRLAIWAGSLQQIVTRPFFGSGPEGYWLSGCCHRAFLQAHNFALQFLMEFGAIGCGIVALLLFRVSRRLGGVVGLRSLVFATKQNRVLACLLCAYVAYSLVDQTMYHLVPLLLIAPMVGFFAAGLYQARHSAMAPIV